MTERERVMNYLRGRFHSAWTHGDDEEARSCHRFFSILEEMTDDAYLDAYVEETKPLAA